MMQVRNNFSHLVLGSLLLSYMSAVGAFPIDGYAETGIERLEGFRLAKEGKVAGNRLMPGAYLNTDQIQLRMQEHPEFEIPAPDPGLTRKIVGLLGAEAKNYSISVLDLSDPYHPVFAEHNPAVRRNPGSVGKLMVALAIFQTLTDLYPDDIAARERVLKNTQVTADGFIRIDTHDVPFWKPEINRMPRRALRVGDTGNLWMFLDWAMSASSNAAASMVIKQLMLLKHFGTAYPASAEEEAAYFNDTKKQVLGDELLDAILTPVTRNGLDVENLRQGSFFTSEGKRRVPGTNSIATTRELMHFLLLLEQGKLVDAWSSLQIKKLIYMTQRRIRYAASPKLNDAAVYFKSGSLYRCKPEEGFVCKKYHGNVENLMNSVAIVESPAGAPQMFYMVTLTSNVLRKNSAVEHQTIATRLHVLLRDLNRVGQSVPAAPK